MQGKSATLRERLRAKTPSYDGRKSDVELLAMAVANNVFGQLCAQRMDEAAQQAINGATAVRTQPIETVYVIRLPGKGKVRDWQIDLLRDLVNERLKTGSEEYFLWGYRFVHDAAARIIRFDAVFQPK